MSLRKKAVFRKDRRREGRVEEKVSVIVHSTSNCTLKALYFAKNISESGLFLEGPSHSFDLGAKVYMEINVPMPLGSKRIRLIARIIREEKRGTRYGVAFEKIFENDRSFLAGLIKPAEIKQTLT